MRDMSDLHEHAASNGIKIPDQFPQDGSFFRFSPNGSKNKDGYLSYFINADGSHVCVYGDWVNHPPGNDFRWCSRKRSEMSDMARKQLDKTIRESRVLAEKQRKKQYAEAAKKALEIWDRAKAVGPDHPYLVKKQVKPHGLRRWGNALAIPVRLADGSLSSLQYIMPDGEKKFMPGGQVAGGCYSIKSEGNQGTVYIAEGFATGATIHEITGQTVVISFNCHNLITVAGAVRAKHPDRKIVIAADNDQFTDGNPGIKAAMEAKKKIDASVVVPTFQDTAEKPTDWNDLFRLEGPEEVRRQLCIDTPDEGLKYLLDEVKAIIRKWLHLEDDRAIDLIMACYVSNLFKADPIWLILIAPPSNTKTELLRSFEGHKSAVFISNLTPSTLVSGILPKKNKPEPSLLPKLNNKMVILKDFTTILSMRSENQQEIIAQFRECYDGQYSKMFGNGKEINWTGRFGLMAACTPVYDSHYGVIGAMGERFLLYRTESMDGESMGMQAQKIVGQEDVMRAEISKSVHKFINQFKDVEGVKFEQNEDVNHKIIDLACFCAYGRCPVERDRYTQAVKYQPAPEGTPRLVKQFMQIGRGLALVHGGNCIDEKIYKTVKKIGMDLLPAHRLRILKYLWEEKAMPVFSHWKNTTDIATDINMPGRTATVLLEDLMVLGALNRERGKADGGRPPWLWQLSDKVSQYIGGACLFDE